MKGWLVTVGVLFLLGAAAPAPPRVDRAVTVREAVELSLRHNPALAARRSELEEARGEKREAEAARLPAISGTYYLTTGNFSNIFSSAPGVMPQNLFLVPSKSFYDLNATLMVPLFTGGTLSARVREADLRLLRDMKGVDEAANETALRTVDLFYRALYARESVRVVEEWEKRVEAQLARTQGLLEVGKVPRVDLLRDEAELAMVRQNRSEADREVEGALLDLKAFLGVPLESSLTLASGFDDSPMTISEDEALRTARARRPELAGATANRRSAEERVRAARGAFLPQIAVMGMYDVFRSTRAPEGSRGENGFTVGLITSLPLFDGGTRSARVARMEGMRDKAAAEERGALLRVENEVRQSFLALRTAARNVTAAEAALAHAEEYLRVTEARHETGRAIKVEVYDALLVRVRSRANHLKALFDLSVANARLKRAIGQLAPRLAP